MEEDIKILESYLNGDKIYDTELDNALRNLIARNKELEEIKKAKLDKYLYKNQWICKDLAENYVHKSKLKEILEKLKGHNYKCNFDDVNFLQNIIIEIQSLLKD